MKKSKALKGVIRSTFYGALKAGRKVKVPEIAKQIISDHPELIRLESDGLVLAAIKEDLTRLARIEVDDPGKPTLFGFPQIIAVPEQEGGYSYLQVPKARWSELQAGRALRVENLQRAQAKLDSYDAALETVRPMMEGTGLTFEEAFGKQEFVERTDGNGEDDDDGNGETD